MQKVWGCTEKNAQIIRRKKKSSSTWKTWFSFKTYNIFFFWAYIYKKKSFCAVQWVFATLIQPANVVPEPVKAVLIRGILQQLIILIYIFLWLYLISHLYCYDSIFMTEALTLVYTEQLMPALYWPERCRTNPCNNSTGQQWWFFMTGTLMHITAH